jgi:hypothetical protein
MSIQTSGARSKFDSRSCQPGATTPWAVSAESAILLKTQFIGAFTELINTSSEVGFTDVQLQFFASNTSGQRDLRRAKDAGIVVPMDCKQPQGGTP